MAAVVVLSLPPRPELLHVLRSVTTSVAALADMPVDAVDDLCVAVDEAATMLLSAGGVRERLRVELILEGSEVGAVISGDAAPTLWPPADFEKGFAWRVLSTLTDSHTLVLEDGGPQVRLGKRTPDLV